MNWLESLIQQMFFILKLYDILQFRIISLPTVSYPSDNPLAKYLYFIYSYRMVQSPIWDMFFELLLFSNIARARSAKQK